MLPSVMLVKSYTDMPDEITTDWMEFLTRKELDQSQIISLRYRNIIQSGASVLPRRQLKSLFIRGDNVGCLLDGQRYQLTVLFEEALRILSYWIEGAICPLLEVNVDMHDRREEAINAHQWWTLAERFRHATITTIKLHSLNLSSIPPEDMYHLATIKSLRTIELVSCKLVSAQLTNAFLCRIAMSGVTQAKFECLQPEDDQHYEITDDAVLDFCFTNPKALCEQPRRLSLMYGRLSSQFSSSFIQKSAQARCRLPISLTLHPVTMLHQALDNVRRNLEAGGLAPGCGRKECTGSSSATPRDASGSHFDVA